ncbi:cytochrome P450-dit2 [Allomyces arbusculus]|nr:cytochrome P450-dit2 [Allomyces arbusculus]
METTSQLVASLHDRLPAGASEFLTASLPAAVVTIKAISPSRALRIAGALAAAVAAYNVVKALITPRALRQLACVGPITTIRVMLRGLGFMETFDVLTDLARQDAERRGLILPGEPVPGAWVSWFGGWVVTLANPADVKQSMNDPATFEKVMFDEIGLDLHQQFFGSNVVMSNGGEWKRHRKVVNSAFRRGWSTHFFGDAGRDLVAELDKLAAHNEPMDPADWMHRAALDALCVAAFGDPMHAVSNPDTRVLNLYHDLMRDIFNQVGNVLPITRLFSRRTTQMRIHDFNEFLYQIIDKKSAEMATTSSIDNDDDEQRARRNLLELMIAAARDETFSREDLRANLLVFFLAGHDTTANALCYAIYLLGLHPEVQAKARAEVLDVMGLDMNAASIPAQDAPYPTNDEQTHLHYLTKVIKETMRLFPSIGNIPFRRVTKDVTLASNGMLLPRGTVTAVDLIALQRSPRWWGPTAAKFNPDRWADGDEAMHPTDWAWAPFSGGPRICMGSQFSLIEQRVLLAMLLTRYEWSVVGDDAALKGIPRTLPGILLQPVGIRVQMRRRGA